MGLRLGAGRSRGLIGGDDEDERAIQLDPIVWAAAAVSKIHNVLRSWPYYGGASDLHGSRVPSNQTDARCNADNVHRAEPSTRPGDPLPHPPCVSPWHMAEHRDPHRQLSHGFAQGVPGPLTAPEEGDLGAVSPRKYRRPCFGAF